MADIFISYASQDRAKARQLAELLEETGWSVFWDRTIPTGKTWDQFVETELDSARSVVVLWSKSAVASDWVRSEAEDARRRGVLLPAIIDRAITEGKVKIPLAFRMMQAADLSGWRAESDHPGLRQLLQDVAELFRTRGPHKPVVKEPVLADGKAVALETVPTGVRPEQGEASAPVRSFRSQTLFGSWQRTAALCLGAVLVLVLGYQWISASREVRSTVTITAKPDTIERGQTSTLSWKTTNASKIQIEPGLGEVRASGSREVKPQLTTRYEVRGNSQSGVVIDSVLITVKDPTPVKKVKKMVSDTITDSRYPLMWTRKDNGRNLDWHQANQYCEDLRLAGYSDWRLPDPKELSTIYVAGNVTGRWRNLEIHTADGFELSHPWIWSSHQKEEGSAAVSFYFVSGGLGDAPLDNPHGGRVLCVRYTGK